MISAKQKPFFPIRFQSWEMLIMRILFAVLVWDSFPGRVAYKGQPVPVGLAHFIDFSFLTNEGLFDGLTILLAVSLVVYVSGRFLWLALPVMLALKLATGTISNSQGAITHHTQIVTLIILAQAVYICVRAAGERFKFTWISPISRLDTQRNAVYISQQVAVAAYMASALTKILKSGLIGWIAGARYFPLQLAKTERMNYYNTLEEQLAAPESFSDRLPFLMEDLFMTYPVVCGIFLAVGLFLELFAVLAMCGRRWNFVYGATIIIFHLTVSQMMNLNFVQNMFVLSIFFLNLPYWGWRIFVRMIRAGSDLAGDQEDSGKVISG